MLHIYIDGSARGNGKEDSRGGYGIIIFNEDMEIIDSYCCQENHTTNNRMELMAFLKTFEILDTKYQNIPVIVYSDSAYCINTLTSWIHTWSQNGWRNSKKEPIKNIDIIQSLYKYYTKDFFINQVEYRKVDGHRGIIGNELADALATANISKFSKLILKNHIKIIFEEESPCKT